MTSGTRRTLKVLGIAGSQVIMRLAAGLTPLFLSLRGLISRQARLPVWAWGALGGFALVVATLHELRTSELQSLLFSSWAGRLSYSVGPGPSQRIVYPTEGPLDRRRGYARLPEFRRRLEARGYRIVEQARFSTALSVATRFGVSPPYREPSYAGLVIHGQSGTLMDATGQADQFDRFEEIPPVVVNTLLFMENRDLGRRVDRRANPAVEWTRFTKAGLMFAAGRFGIPVRREGGSTLAVQLEKFRHSEEGRTSSGVDKLRQIFAASLKAYRDGPDSREARQAIILDYLNSIPLAAARGHGEVQGLKEGLRVWFGVDPDQTFRALEDASPGARAQALKPILALLYSVRAPSRYLMRDRSALERRVLDYSRLLEREGVIDANVARRMRVFRLRFASVPATVGLPPFAERKAADRIRRDLYQLLGVHDLYELDRLHLEVESTIDVALQDETNRLFGQLEQSDFVESNGLRGERLLSQGDPGAVIYSLAIYESEGGANLVRAETDNLDRPFDVNDGMKMELGSTAKLRTLAHYLELVAGLHAELSHLSATQLAERTRTARDPITLWAATTLRHAPGLPLDSLLQRSLDRTYSGSPGEGFFTGGGLHYFHNFSSDDNGRILSVREATVRSTNLVFVRLMRDLVRFHEARLKYDAKAVLSQPVNPVRLRMLSETADQEMLEMLSRAHRRYRDRDLDDIVTRLLGTRASSPQHLAVLFYAWNPGADRDSLGRWLASRGADLAPEQVTRLEEAYGNPRFNLLDYGYLLDRHPLELWCAGVLAREPDLDWNALQERSVDARRAATAWLFGPKRGRAQNLRLMTRIERDAFARMTPDWQRLGFPFEHLVPSYATSIGSSSDRPSALADLMGIIVNDGMRRAPQLVRRLSFAPGTPYQTTFEAPPESEERVMPASVARALRGLLAGVVEKGTARRLSGVFSDSTGAPITIGGKTGSGDNRYLTFGKGGGVIARRPVSRTAAFVFYLGDRYYGVVTASVSGPRAGDYTFTSSLPLEVLKLLAPSIQRRFGPITPIEPNRLAQAGSDGEVTLTTSSLLPTKALRRALAQASAASLPAASTHSR